ncbi:SemiSWEET transporter [Sphingobacterium paludis]|uniref:MtN3 and saliva related transmembrane protein n=1 Tax=Sphingobacterium paludis TaxID=1476465 RepID=A0A4R7CVG1_9SPHI|nr:SemiSWEET transporter [Sphingobacterium paludis]TDS12160.1 MtN3 and saliva related transmembrane protein [Sphingobacterium paludis]
METWIGSIAGILTSISMVPQLWKVIRTKEVDDLSWPMLITLIFGVALWVFYGLLHMEWPIILSNSFSFIVNCTVLTYYFLFSKK